MSSKSKAKKPKSKKQHDNVYLFSYEMKDNTKLPLLNEHDTGLIIGEYTFLKKYRVQKDLTLKEVK